MATAAECDDAWTTGYRAGWATVKSTTPSIPSRLMAPGEPAPSNLCRIEDAPGVTCDLGEWCNLAHSVARRWQADDRRVT